MFIGLDCFIYNWNLNNANITLTQTIVQHYKSPPKLLFKSTLILTRKQSQTRENIGY